MATRSTVPTASVAKQATGLVPGAQKAASTVQAAAATAKAAVPQIDKALGTTSNVLMGKEDAAALSYQLANTKTGFLDNPFNDYPSVTYKWRLFMAAQDDILAGSKTDGSGNISSDAVFTAVDNATKIVVAESGVTAGYNIRDVRLEQLVAPTDVNTNQNTTDIQITLTEPNGTSLFDAIRNSAAVLGISNYNQAIYYLELRFVAYDEGGFGPVNPLEDAGIDNGGRWIWGISITNIQTNFDASGSTYVITALPSSEIRSGQEHGLMDVPDLITIQGSTIGDMLDSLGKNLTAAWKNRKVVELYKYKFKVHPMGDQDPSNFTLVPSDTDQNTVTHLDMEKGKVPTMVVNQNTTINSIIDELFACSPDAQKIAKDVQQANDADLSSDQSTTTKTRSAVTFRIETDQALGPYNQAWGDYERDIIIHIWPMETTRTILSPRQVKDATDENVQIQRIKDLQSKGFFRKRYDYLFTGLNTEVLRLDIKYNLTWSAVLPRFYAYGATNESASLHAKRVGEANDAAQQVDKAFSDITNIKAQLDTKNASLTDATKNSEDQATIKSLKGEVQQLTSQLGAAQSRLVNAQNAFRIKNGALEQDKTPNSRPTTSGGKTLYAEDYANAETDNIPPIRFTQAIANQTITGTSMPHPTGRDRGLYGAILDQLYSPMTSEMLQVDMEIRGDPYWLGYGNLERRAHMDGSPPPLSASATAASYYAGDQTVLVRVNMPYDIAEDGTVNLRVNDENQRTDFFNGMYTVYKVTHVFEGGQFKQTLQMIQQPLLRFAKELGYSGVEGVANAQTGTAAATPTATAGSGAKPKAAIPSSQVRALINNAAAKVGVSQKTLTAVIGAESSFNPNAGASTSSAKGLGQFTQPTWDTYVAKYGAQYGITREDIYDPEKNATMTALLMKDDTAYLQQHGLDTNAANLYSLHFLGASGGISFLNGVRSDPNAPVSNYVSEAAIRANPSILKGKTVAQAYAILNGKMNSFGA